MRASGMLDRRFRIGPRLFEVDVGNMDGRSGKVRRYRDILTQIEQDLGGAECLSEAQHQLARRATTLCLMAEGMEADAITGQPTFDLDDFVTMTNALAGVVLSASGFGQPTFDLDDFVTMTNALAGVVLSASGLSANPAT
jgi:hypothetical protein